MRRPRDEKGHGRGGEGILVGSVGWFSDFFDELWGNGGGFVRLLASAIRKGKCGRGYLFGWILGSRKARGRAILYGTCFQANLPDIWWVIYVGDGNGERRCHTKHHGSNAVYFSVFGGASRVGQERQWLCRARGCGYSLLDSWAKAEGFDEWRGVPVGKLRSRGPTGRAQKAAR